MGGILSSIIMPVVTFDYDEIMPFYYNYIEPYIYIPTFKRITAINWTTLGSKLWSSFTTIITHIPRLIWSIIKLIFEFIKMLFRQSFYPIIIITPIVLGYYVIQSMSQPGVISPRRLKESNQKHFLSNERTYASHPLRVYADEAASI